MTLVDCAPFLYLDLTGGTGKEISTAKVNADALHDQLLDFQKQGFLLGCGSNPGSDTNVSGLGIVQGHAYAILNVVKVDEIRLIKLRNPWGQKEWTGTIEIRTAYLVILR